MAGDAHCRLLPLTDRQKREYVGVRDHLTIRGEGGRGETVDLEVRYRRGRPDRR